MAAPQPGLEPLAANRPSLPVTIDQEIDKCGACGRMKELGRDRIGNEHILAEIGVRAANTFGLESHTGSWSLRRRIGRHLTRFHARVLPKLAGDFDGVDAGGLPPGSLVAGAMGGPVMRPAERDREFITRFAAQRAWLHVAQMMGVGRLAAADKARLLHDIAKVLAAAIAPRGSEREDALVDALRVIWGDGFGADGVLRSRWPNYRRIVRRSCSSRI